MEEESWAWERVFAAAYTIAFPFGFASVCLCYRCCCCFCCKPSLHPALFLVLSLSWSITLGLFWALWIHWIPCWRLTCDHGEYDDEELRIVLLFGTWPVFSLLFSMACNMGVDCGPLKQDKTHFQFDPA